MDLYKILTFIFLILLIHGLFSLHATFVTTFREKIGNTNFFLVCVVILVLLVVVIARLSS